MAIKVRKGDYCIARTEGKKDYLFKALSDNDSKSVEAVVEKNSHIPGQRKTLTVELSDVILNLGSKPYPGKVYGYDVSALHYKRFDHSEFGMVHYFYKPSKDVLVDLNASMDKVAKRLKKQGLSFLLNDVLFEVYPYISGKYAGMFLKSKQEGVMDRVQIHPEIMPASEYAYIWFHELGHRLHLSFCTSKKLNATWLKLYMTSIKPQTVKKDTSQKLLDLLLDGEEAPSDFKRGLEEEDALAFKWIVRTIQQVNAVSLKDLDTLFEAEMKEEIRSVWPVRNIAHKELAPIVTEYATVNVKELFAEVFALYMVGKKLPDSIVKLMEKSISYAKANREKGNDSE